MKHYCNISLFLLFMVVMGVLAGCNPNGSDGEVMSDEDKLKAANKGRQGGYQGGTGGTTGSQMSGDAPGERSGG